NVEALLFLDVVDDLPDLVPCPEPEFLADASCGVLVIEIELRGISKRSHAEQFRETFARFDRMLKLLEVDLYMLLRDVRSNKLDRPGHQRPQKLSVDLLKIARLTKGLEHPLERVCRNALDPDVDVRRNRNHVFTRGV